MKRALSLFLALTLCLPLCFSLSACGDKNIKLTLDNYKDYFEISTYVVPGKDVPANSFVFDDMNGKGCYAEHLSTYLAVGASVNGVSDKFTYSDIVVTVRVTGKFLMCTLDSNPRKYSVPAVDFTLKVNCDLNVSGKGSGVSTEKYELPKNWVYPGMLFATTTEFTYEIVSVSGSITPA